MPEQSTTETGVFEPLLAARALAPVCRPGTRGRVVIQQGGATRTMWWSDGHIRAVTSANDNEWLGTWLLTRGLVSGPALARALKSRGEGERLGAALVRLGYLNALRLQMELEELSYTLAGRIIVAEGTFAAERGVAVPSGAETVHRSPRALFAAGVRRITEVETLERLLADGGPWQALPATVVPEKGCELSPIERTVLDQLTTAKTVEAIRLNAAEQHAETVRALAVLVAIGLATPLRTGVTAGSGALGESVVTRPGSRVAEVQLPPASPKVKELLTRLETAEGQELASSGASGPTPQDTPTRRKGEAFRRTALRMLAEGEDEKAAYRLLTRAAALAPSAAVMVDLARYEIRFECWHSRVVEHLKRALQINSRCEEAWALLAEYWAIRKQPDKQRRTLERWLAAIPDSAAARDQLARLNGRDSAKGF